LRIVQTACQVDGGVQTAFEGLADGQEVAEDFEVGNIQVEFAAQRGGIEAGALTDVDGVLNKALIGNIEAVAKIEGRGKEGEGERRRKAKEDRKLATDQVNERVDKIKNRLEKNIESILA